MWLKTRLSVCFIFGIFMGPLQAILDIEVTQGIDASIPIAVLSFASPYQKAQLPYDVGEVIQSDLLRSGQFRVRTHSEGITPHKVSDLHSEEWIKESVDAVLLGRMEMVAGDRVSVDFELVDLYSHRKGAVVSAADFDPDLPQVESQGGSSGSLKSPTHAVLLAQHFVVSMGQLRGLAHHIADLVYEKMTGVKGIFSTKIAYVNVKRRGNHISRYVLEVADMDGHNPKPLLTSSEPIMSPRWDPTGQRLAYVSFEKKRSGVYMMDVRTGTRRLLAAFPGINGAPSWSPDGQKLALVLSHEVTPKIYTLDLKTRKLQQITRGTSLDTEPAWSPDGRSLIYTSNQGGRPQIYRYDFASGRIERITYEGDYNARPSYTPDGRKIVMLHRSNGRYNIAVQDLETGVLQVLTATHLDESPSVAPNGQRVIYAIRDSDRIVLGEVSLDGRVQLRLPARDGDVQEPAWSPFLSG